MNGPMWVVLLSGAVMGVIIGAIIATPTERRIRNETNLPERRLYVAIFRSIFFFAAVCVAGFLISFGIMRLGGIDHLARGQRIPFGMALLVGAAGGKFARYLFWKFRESC